MHDGFRFGIIGQSTLQRGLRVRGIVLDLIHMCKMHSRQVTSRLFWLAGNSLYGLFDNCLRWSANFASATLRSEHRSMLLLANDSCTKQKLVSNSQNQENIPNKSFSLNGPVPSILWVRMAFLFANNLRVRPGTEV